LLKIHSGIELENEQSRFLKEAAVSRKKDIDFSDQNGYHSAILLSG